MYLTAYINWWKSEDSHLLISYHFVKVIICEILVFIDFVGTFGDK